MSPRSPQRPLDASLSPVEGEQALSGPTSLMRPRRGRHVHVVTEGRFNLRSLCDTGPSSVRDAKLWIGEPSEVTCPQCQKRSGPRQAKKAGFA